MCLLSFPCGLQAQRGYVGVGFASFAGSGEGIQRAGCASKSESGYGAWAGYDVVGRTVALQGRVRVHNQDPGPGCGIPSPPPEDGTRIVRERRNFLQYEFVTTDLRVRVTPTVWRTRPSLAIGAGQAWREGSNFPYALISGGIGFALPFGFRMGVEGTLYEARVRFDDFQRTWQNHMLVSEVPLGPVREWRSIRSGTVFLELPLGGTD